MKEPVVVSWSGGKDSALALHEILRSAEFEVLALLTTLIGPSERISMHGVRRVLLDKQAESLGLPLATLTISKGASNAEYETKLLERLGDFRNRGVTRVVFGDLFLEDIRDYREGILSRIGMSGLYPLWHRDTGRLAQELISLGFRALVVCVDPKAMSPSFAGREIDAGFIRSLPPGVDPCGENGEFHTFVFDGPIFNQPIKVRVGEVEDRDSFYYCDLVPAW